MWPAHGLHAAGLCIDFNQTVHSLPPVLVLIHYQFPDSLDKHCAFFHLAVWESQAIGKWHGAPSSGKCTPLSTHTKGGLGFPRAPSENLGLVDEP